MDHSENFVAAFLSLQIVQSLLSWLAGISLATFFLSLILIPYIVSKLDPECFLTYCKEKSSAQKLTFLSLLILILKNIAGFILLLAGIAMIFLPGQGLLTILLGILLLSFPGKRHLVMYLISSPKIRHSLDWIRKKCGQPSFIWPEP
ncbi:MAG: hypothetical protein OEL83_19225 [Desulforhopalus sp.]|nr:hypothetical protein [Desulforhopalus sp.]